MARQTAPALSRFSDWQDCGRITLRDGCPIPPKDAPKSPGVYRMVYLDGIEYFGEGFNLHRRLKEHCAPFTSRSDRQKRRWLIKTGGARVFARIQLGVMTSDGIRQEEAAFPGAKSARLACEKRCIIEARSRRARVRNWSIETGFWDWDADDGDYEDCGFEMFPDHEDPHAIAMARW
jgi:hypothetical protein